MVDILDELDDLGFTNNTIVIYTSDYVELAGAHGLPGKGATCYREQNNVPFIITHPDYPGGKLCKAVTSRVDISTTLLSNAKFFAEGGNPQEIADQGFRPYLKKRGAIRDV